MTPYLFVLVPLGLYLPLFGYETYSAFKRLGSRKKSRAYVDATWEVTHTFLIIGLTNFIWLFSGQAVSTAKAVYWGLIISGAFFIVRAILYLHLFYFTEAKSAHNSLADKLFAFSHAAILGGLAYTIVRGASALAGKDVTVNTAFIPWMWPGLILLLGLGAIPLLRLYTTRD